MPQQETSVCDAEWCGQMGGLIDAFCAGELLGPFARLLPAYTEQLAVKRLEMAELLAVCELTLRDDWTVEMLRDAARTAIANATTPTETEPPHIVLFHECEECGVRLTPIEFAENRRHSDGSCTCGHSTFTRITAPIVDH